MFTKPRLAAVIVLLASIACMPVQGQTNDKGVVGVTIPAGSNLFKTSIEGIPFDDLTMNPIPANGLGFTHREIDDFLLFEGQPVDTNPPFALGDVDTVVERQEAIQFTTVLGGNVQTANVEIVALALVSTGPVNLSGVDYDVAMFLSSSAPAQIGQVTYEHPPSGSSNDGGTFSSSLPISPRLIFIPRVQGQPLGFFDYNNQARGPVMTDFYQGQWYPCDGDQVPDGQVGVNHDGDPGTATRPTGGLPASGNLVTRETLTDCNQNGTPDLCEADFATDCNNNKILDECELASGAATDYNRNGIIDACDFSSAIQQVTYVDRDGNVVLANSDYGELLLDAVPSPGPGNVSWVNLFVGYPGRWAVQNAPITGFGAEGDPLHFQFPFSLGNNVGTQVNQRFVACVISPQPITAAEDAPLPSQVEVFGVNRYAGNTNDATFTDTLPFNQPGPAEDFSNGVPTGNWEIVHRNNIPGVSEEINHCVPGGAARSLAWMNDLYCLGLPPACDSVREIYDVLKDGNHMMTTTASGTTTRTGDGKNKMVEGLNKLIADKMLGDKISVDWEKYFSDPPSVDDLTDALSAGKDVIMQIGWLNNAGGRSGGHAITVVGYIKCGTEVTIYYRDDALAGDSQGNTTADSRTKSAKINLGSGNDTTSTDWSLTGIGRNRHEGFVAICPNVREGAGAIDKYLDMVGPLIDSASSSMTVPDATERQVYKRFACDVYDLSCYLVEQFKQTNAPPECQDPADLIKIAALDFKINAILLCFETDSGEVQNLLGSMSDNVSSMRGSSSSLVIKLEPTPTPSSTATSTSTATVTNTSTATGTPTETSTSTETPTVTDTATSTYTPTITATITNTATQSPTFSPTVTVTNTPTVTATPSSTPTSTVTNTPTSTPTATPTYTWTVTQTPTVTRTEGPPQVKRLVYSIERDTPYAGGSRIALEGDALVGGSLATIRGGGYEELLAAFLKDPIAEGRRLGLDGIDAVSIERGELTRAFFSTERSFRVTRKGHPLFGATVSDGDLLSKSGIVYRNAAVAAPFDVTREIGLDAIDVEGIGSGGYDAWTASFFQNAGDATPPAGVAAGARIYFSFEEINEEVTIGAGASTSLGAGTSISADDVLVNNLATGVGDVFRTGADGLPATTLNILVPFSPDGAIARNLGLDAVDMPDFPGESDESGETGIVEGPENGVLFSTSLDDSATPRRFRHGDLLVHTPDITSVSRVHESITGQSRIGDIGLDAVDCVGVTEVRTGIRERVCRMNLFVSNFSAGGTPNVSLRVYGPSGCEVQNMISLTYDYSSFELAASNPPVVAGSNFRVVSFSKSGKGVGMTTDNIVLERTSPGTENEMLCELKFQALGPISEQGTTVDFTNVIPDGGVDIANAIVDPVLRGGSAPVPSQPLLTTPGTITEDSIDARWFLNDPIESVNGYTVTILSVTGQTVASASVGSVSNAVVGGLQPATDYELRLVATNANGDSEAASYRFTTRVDVESGQSATLLERLSSEWNPAGAGSTGLQSQIPAAGDFDLDGDVDGSDLLAILRLHLQRVSQ